MSESLTLAELTGISIIKSVDRFLLFFGGLLGISVLIDAFLSVKMFVFDTLVLPSFILFLLFGLFRICSVPCNLFFVNLKVEMRRVQIMRTIVSAFGTYIVIGLLYLFVVPSNTVPLLLLASTGILMIHFTTT